jgi:hypothetical protein
VATDLESDAGRRELLKVPGHALGCGHDSSFGQNGAIGLQNATMTVTISQINANCDLCFRNDKAVLQILTSR